MSILIYPTRTIFTFSAPCIDISSGTQTVRDIAPYTHAAAVVVPSKCHARTNVTRLPLRLHIYTHVYFAAGVVRGVHL